jgi:O-antigen/teichoic acid export membrane protein
MIPEIQASVNNITRLMMQRGLYFVSCLLFAALLPRLMGAEIFGQYALITSLSIWFVMISNLGFTQIIGRHVPQMAVQETLEHIGKFFGNLLILRIASGALGAGLYVLLTLLWLRDLDRMVLVIMGVTIFVRAVSHQIFSLFLGLNQAGRWGMDETVRRWLWLILIVAGFFWGGLRGACLGMLLSEVAVLALGLWWAWPHFSWSNLRLNIGAMTPVLGFGLIFFASDLIIAGFDHSGELMVRKVLKDYVQVGYFGLAYTVYLNCYVILLTFTNAFVPLLGTLLAKQDRENIKIWVERLIKGLGMCGVVAVFAVLLMGEDLVPVILGTAYQPVAANLVPLMLTLVAQALSGTGYVLALTFGRPGTALGAAGLKFAAYWALGPLFVYWWGSMGGCLAVLSATILHGVYITWRMRAVIFYNLRDYALVAGLGALLLPLTWLRSSWSLNLALFTGFLLIYGMLLFLLKVISRAEIAATWRVFKSCFRGGRPAVEAYELLRVGGHRSAPHLPGQYSAANNPVLRPNFSRKVFAKFC